MLPKNRVPKFLAPLILSMTTCSLSSSMAFSLSSSMTFLHKLTIDGIQSEHNLQYRRSSFFLNRMLVVWREGDTPNDMMSNTPRLPSRVRENLIFSFRHDAANVCIPSRPIVRIKTWPSLLCVCVCVFVSLRQETFILFISNLIRRTKYRYDIISL